MSRILSLEPTDRDTPEVKLARYIARHWNRMNILIRDSKIANMSPDAISELAVTKFDWKRLLDELGDVIA